ncbi:MAG: CoA-binding protein [Actinomycetia bacterium]|nr:CoA-binding protein [Actinomycetes bacterium]
MGQPVAAELPQLAPGPVASPAVSEANDPVTELLAAASTLAVVGCSANPAKAAHTVPRSLQQRGYRVIPVHPTAYELLGEPVRRSLADIEDPVDIVVVFRPSAEAGAVVGSAIEAGAPAVWLQQGITSAAGRERAERAGVHYVEDRCMIIEVKRRDLWAAGHN